MGSAYARLDIERDGGGKSQIERTHYEPASRRCKDPGPESYGPRCNRTRAWRTKSALAETCFSQRSELSTTSAKTRQCSMIGMAVLRLWLCHARYMHASLRQSAEFGTTS